MPSRIRPLQRLLAILPALFAAAPPAPLSAQVPPPGVNGAIEALLDSAADPELAAACRKIRNGLDKFIGEQKRPAWDEGAPPEELDSPEKLAAKIAQLDRGETIEAYIRHSAEFLLRHPAHPEFAERLWRLSATVELFERAGRKLPLEVPLYPQLIAACDKLPPENRFYLEGKFLSARHFHAEGEFPEEQEVLREVISGGTANAGLRFTARALIGRSLEAEAKFDEALEVYAKTTGELAVLPAASDTAFRSALIHLEHNRRGEALKLLHKLADTDPALRKLSGSKSELASVLPALGKRASLERYWDHSAKWWPKWVALREKLGWARPENEIRIAERCADDATKLELASAAAEEDRDRFNDRLDLQMHGLRWVPAAIDPAASSLCFLATRLHAAHKEDIYRLVLDICEGFPDSDRGAARAAMIYQTISHSELGAGAKAVEVIEAYRADDPEPDELSATMTRMWAHLALAGETELDGPLAALEAMFAGGGTVDSRAQSVFYLAQIYRELGRLNDERKLLEKQLEEPDLLADERLAIALQARLNELDASGDGDALAAAVADWRAEHAPGWLQFALPLGKDDPRLKDATLPELLADPSELKLSSEERVQFELLATAEPDVSVDAKARAFRAAFAGLYGDSPTHSDARKMLRDVLRDDRFPKAMRQMLLVFSLDEALANGRKRDITNVLTHPLLDRDNERLLAAVQAYGRFTTADQQSPESLVGCYNDLSAGSVDSAELTVIAEVFETLLELGALAEAEKIADSVGDWDLAAGVRQGKNTLKLAFLKSLRRARGAVPFGRAMREQLAKHADLDALEPPGLISNYRDGFDIKRLPEAEGFALLAGRASDPHVLQTAPRFWTELAELMPRDERQVEFSFALMETLLASELPDLEKSFGIFASPSVIDTDNPELFERLITLFDKHRDPSAAPRTHAAMRVVEVQSRDLRQGKAIDLDTAWRDLDHPALGGVLMSAKIRNLMARHDKDKLRLALDALPPETLLAIDMIDLTWPALEMVGMEDEAELAREVALENLPAFVSAAARRLDFGMIRMVYDTAKRTGRPELVPEGWFEYLAEQIHAERDRYTLHIIDAEFREDWEALAKWSGLAVRDFPTYYNYYRPRGLALHRLGKAAEAIAALETYTRYSRDEVEWKSAMELLEKLRSK